MPNEIIAESQREVEGITVSDINTEERMSKPEQLRSLHNRFALDDKDTSENRAIIQEGLDFLPPYDQAELDQRGMGERFNVNFGLAASIKNEAVGAYLDLLTSPVALTKIALEPDVDDDKRDAWAAIMSEEWTKMMRSWDAWQANGLLLADIFVSQGIGIPWFNDKASILFEVGSLEDCKFPADAVAIPSKNEIMTIKRSFTISELYAKIEKAKDQASENINGWNGRVIKKLIETAKPKAAESAFGDTDFEARARAIKASRLGSSNDIPTVEVIWGVVKELDGRISVYAVPQNAFAGKDTPKGSIQEDDCWLYKKRNAYEDVNQAYQIFPFSIGNKNRIYTIRGLGYAIHEAGQADNVLRCKMMDAARHRSSEIYQAERVVESAEDIQFIDGGHCLIAPPGLKNLQSTNSMRLDQSIGFALQSNVDMMSRHSSGLARNSISDNPNARRNEMQVTFEMQNLDKMQGFALSLWYGPYDKLMRELVRRSFQETQTDLAASRMVSNMKKACERRGVPPEIFDKIDLPATQATRLMGAGSKGSRVVMFQQMSQLFSSMDAQGQEFFMFDFATEIVGGEKAERYFGVPGQRRGHVDEAIAQLENDALLEGDMLDPIDGENRMVHLQSHLGELVTGVEEVNEGVQDLADWTMRHIPLYRHTVDTLERTTVHESRIQELNSFRQQLQQVGELIDNGLRHINKLREQGELAPEGQVDEAGNPIPADPNAPQGQEMTASQRDNEAKMNRIFAEGQAKISLLAQQSAAKIAINQQESIARIGVMDAEAAAKIKRQQILDRAMGSRG